MKAFAKSFADHLTSVSFAFWPRLWTLTRLAPYADGPIAWDNLQLSPGGCIQPKWKKRQHKVVLRNKHRTYILIYIETCQFVCWSIGELSLVQLSLQALHGKTLWFLGLRTPQVLDLLEEFCFWNFDPEALKILQASSPAQVWRHSLATFKTIKRYIYVNNMFRFSSLLDLLIRVVHKLFCCFMTRWGWRRPCAMWPFVASVSWTQVARQPPRWPACMARWNWRSSSEAALKHSWSNFFQCSMTL